MHTAELLEGSQDLETSIPWSTSIMLDKSKVPSKCSVELKLATWILDANPNLCYIVFVLINSVETKALFYFSRYLVMAGKAV